MRHRGMEWVSELLATQMNHWVVVSLCISVMGLGMRTYTALPVWTIFGLIPVINCILREKIRHLSLFLAAHTVIPAGVILLFPGEDGLLKGLAVLLAVGYSFLSLALRFRAADGFDRMLHPIAALGVIGGLYFLEGRYGVKGWEGYYLMSVFLCLGCYFVHFYISQYLYFVSVNEGSAANIPERAIFSSGIRQTIVFVFIGLLALAATVNVEWLTFLLKGLGRAVAAVLRLLLAGYEPEETESYSDAAGPGQGVMLPMEETETFWLWTVLEYALIAALAAVLVSVVLYGLYRGLRYLWEMFYRKGFYGENVGGRVDGQDFREKCGIERSTREKKRLLSFLDGRERVRRQYRRRMLKERAVLIGEEPQERLGYLTAGECCAKLRDQELLESYEAARYAKK